MDYIHTGAADKAVAHADLIDALGGAKRVATLVSRRAGVETFTPQAVSQWKRRGIPWRYRLMLAEEARERGIGLPRGFLAVGEGRS